MIQRILNIIFQFLNKFKKVDTPIVEEPIKAPPKPDPIAVEPIVEVPPPVEDKNLGDGKNPDWGYISRHAWIDSDRKKDVQYTVSQIFKGQEIYKKVETKTGVPWYVIGLIHLRECSLSFNGCLHNGDKVIGNGRTTHNIPRGRGPFETWEEAAIDALKYDGLTKVTDWSNGNILLILEKYNGLGYRSKIGDTGVIEYSPYVVAGTNWSDETGKYVRDGRFDKTAKEEQLGVLALLIGIGVIKENKS